MKGLNAIFFIICFIIGAPFIFWGLFIFLVIGWISSFSVWIWFTLSVGSWVVIWYFYKQNKHERNWTPSLNVNTNYQEVEEKVCKIVRLDTIENDFKEKVYEITAIEISTGKKQPKKIIVEGNDLYESFRDGFYSLGDKICL